MVAAGKPRRTPKKAPNAAPVTDATGAAGADRPAPTLKGAGPQPASAPMVVPGGYLEVQRLIEAGSPLVFVSGNAGTGKTTLIRYLRDGLDRRSVVLAPTGVAALNAGGATIHSFFRFPPRIQDLRDIRVPADSRLYQRLELIIIDEVSMVRADILDSIDVFLRECQGCSRAFGGVQLLLLGDMFQLPPVVSSAERDVFAARGYASPYFFSALALQDVPLAHVELDEVFRQTDPEFISLLNRLRIGEGTVTAVEDINRHCLRESSDHEITLTCTNRVADDLNEAAMAALDADEAVFLGESEGKFKLDGDRLPSPLELRLKVGARVMFTRNDESGRWVNGSLGIVTFLGGTRVEVELTDGSVHDVERVTWQTFEYRLDRAADRIFADEVGHYRQYPLMLAWAVTIHKSQGKTLGNVLVNFGSGAFAPGQAYVALSRCRSLESIRLARPLRVSDVRCDPRIRRLYQALAASEARSGEGETW
jgi:ATP-dependent DNA helicase PIF1